MGSILTLQALLLLSLSAAAAAELCNIITQVFFDFTFSETITSQRDGGSGAGGSSWDAPFSGDNSENPGIGIIGQGFNGGSFEFFPSDLMAAGGAGGFAEKGASARFSFSQGVLTILGGNGGRGAQVDLGGSFQVVSAGGGGGSTKDGGVGGFGGGGNGASGSGLAFPFTLNGENAAAGSIGCGGGGASIYTTNDDFPTFATREGIGGNGSAGIVIIRYPIGG